MSNKGGRVSPDYLADIAPEYALQILEDCYQRKSVIVTSQLPVSKWYDYINEPTLADAIMDRLTANAVRLELKGDSMRRKNQK